MNTIFQNVSHSDFRSYVREELRANNYPAQMDSSEREQVKRLRKLGLNTADIARVIIDGRKGD